MSYHSSLQPISCSLSLSSCRLKAEAIARALNNRIWPVALINDCDDHSSGDEALQVTTSLKSSHVTKPATAVIDRPPQAHDIYDSGDKIIGHCWLNGMQTDDDDEYFDTPPCSSPPSPAEEEIIVNPPTHNGMSPFFPEYHRYQQSEVSHHSDDLPSPAAVYPDDERIASGTKLFEKLQRYSESLSQNEEGSETFYDVSDYEDYEEQSANVLRGGESDRSAGCSHDLIQSTGAGLSADSQKVERECLQSPDMGFSEEEIEHSDDSPLQLADVNIVMNSEENNENREDPDHRSGGPENSLPDSERPDKVSSLEVTNAGLEAPEPEDPHAADDSGQQRVAALDEVAETSDDSSHTLATPERETTEEGHQNNPEIETVPASPLQSSTSSCSEDEISDLRSDLAADSAGTGLPADFRVRRILELEEEEERPKLLRSTSLKTEKTPPGTPATKKIVRFADALGLDLAAVRHIVQDDLPNVPSSAYTDLHLDDSGQQQPLIQASDPVTFPTSSWLPVAVPGAGSGVQSLIPQFQPPSTRSDFLDRVRSQFVCLESIIVSDLTLHCTCRVLNAAFEKFVAARYTTNEWQSCEEVVASFVPNSSDGVFDKFSFSLFLRYLLPHQRLLFAIRYIVGGREYWDNNNGQNYVLRSHSNAPAVSSTEDGPSWMHHFY